jgi:hypothetical protein
MRQPYRHLTSPLTAPSYTPPHQARLCAKPRSAPTSRRPRSSLRSDDMASRPSPARVEGPYMGTWLLPLLLRDACSTAGWRDERGGRWAPSLCLPRPFLRSQPGCGRHEGHEGSCTLWGEVCRGNEPGFWGGREVKRSQVADLGADLRRQCGDGIDVGQVTGDRVRGNAGTGQSLGEQFQRLPAPGDEHHVVAALCVPLSDGMAKPRARRQTLRSIWA